MTIAPQQPLTTRPEVLAPAGNPLMMKAAVENGADAIYFGLEYLNARLRAANFASAELPATMAWLHERGVKGYVTLNTLVFTGELEEAVRALRVCSDAGVDAVLVQDLGLARLAQELVPDLPVHASTQMTSTCAESVAALDRLGLAIERVVVARELNTRELGRITKETDKEVEVFVHGAICVAYSGQCLTSEALGGRSANRGECAQACRLPYDLVVDGQTRDLGDLRYLLSPKDLAGYEDVPTLMEKGIVSLKIEGRLKSPQYVAATVRSYREAIDKSLAMGKATMDRETRERLEMTFSRGLTGGYLHETNHQAVVEGRFPKKRGLFLGRVTRITRREVIVKLEGPLRCGDGVVFDSGRPDSDEAGGRIYSMKHEGEPIKQIRPDEPCEVALYFGEGNLDPKKVRIGDLLWKTHDPIIEAELSESYAGDRIRYRRPVVMSLRARVGERTILEIRDEEGLTATVTDERPAMLAEQRPATEGYLRGQLERLGNTPFYLVDLQCDLEGSVLLPASQLNELRRRAVEALLEKRRRRCDGRRFFGGALAELIARPTGRVVEAPAHPMLSVLCRTLEQVATAARHEAVGTVYTDFEDMRLHREAAPIIRDGGKRFVPATLRIIKPGEAPFTRKLLDTRPDAVLVRNLASWEIFCSLGSDVRMIGDYALNVSNPLTANLLMEHGFEFLTPSYDLNIDQLGDLLRASNPAWYEITIHQYMPMFHMEHCVFCRFLSDGTDFTNCGRPCEKHSVALRDRMGYEHVLKADAGCRNTVFNATAQSASAYLDGMLRAGVRRYRIDFLMEDKAGTQQAIDAYAGVLRGEREGRGLWKELRAASKLGVTRGNLDSGWD